MRVKPGVNLDGIHFLMLYAAAVHDFIRQSYGLGEGTITGAREGADDFGPARVKATLHPSGRALDFRTSDLPGGNAGDYAHAVAAMMQQQLGRSFDVLVESDHIHVELSPQQQRA